METHKQLKFLRDRQCNEVQGYYFSKAIPPAAFAQMLAEECVWMNEWAAAA